MVYESIDERIMRVKCGDMAVFEDLILEGCGSLYLYAAMIKDSKAERFRLVRETYMIAWDRIRALEIPTRFDIWIKGIMWKQAAIEEGKTETEVKELAEDRVSTLLKRAFREAENYWYLPLDDKRLLAAAVMSDIRCGRSRLN